MPKTKTKNPLMLGMILKLKMLFGWRSCSGTRVLPSDPQPAPKHKDQTRSVSLPNNNYYEYNKPSRIPITIGTQTDYVMIKEKVEIPKEKVAKVKEKMEKVVVEKKMNHTCQCRRKTLPMVKHPPPGFPPVDLPLCSYNTELLEEPTRKLEETKGITIGTSVPALCSSKGNGATYNITHGAAGETYTVGTKSSKEVAQATKKVLDKLQVRRQAKLGWDVIRTQLVSARVRRYQGVDNLVIDGEKYTVLDCIGKGGFAKVYTAYSATDKLVAVKVTNLIEENGEVNLKLLEEVQMMVKLSETECKKVVKMLRYEHRVEEDSNLMFMVMELGQSTLGDKLDSEELSVACIRHYWEAILAAVLDIHLLNIIHMDLKPQNFTFVGGTLKIIDFGLAIQIPAGQESIETTLVYGTDLYMAPECFTSRMVKEEGRPTTFVSMLSLAADVWSLGIILVEMLPLINDQGGSEVTMTSLERLVKRLSPALTVALPGVAETLRMCLNKEAKDRATVDKLQHMQWN